MAADLLLKQIVHSLSLLSSKRSNGRRTTIAAIVDTRWHLSGASRPFASPSACAEKDYAAEAPVKASE
jgi:hypothetical protein